ncbi:hypothetical protein ACWCPQ_03610 [Nocardia sp. NPDC001965]
MADHNTLIGYVQHPRHVGIRPGAYTVLSVGDGEEFLCRIRLDSDKSGAAKARDLPVPLLETLENGRYGRDYLTGLDAGLPG